MDDFMKLIARANPDLAFAWRDWIANGWGLNDEPSPEQIAAALLMEANTQDSCVIDGESAASYPLRLRRVAYKIIDHYHKGKV